MNTNKNQGHLSGATNNDKKKLAALPSIKIFSSRKEWEAACWREILKSKELLDLFITSHERHNMVKRAIVFNRLMAGKSYKQISEELRLSPQTISVVKKSINENSYKSYLERSKKERKKKKYSPWPTPLNKLKPRGRPQRTKYGTIYLP